MAWEVDYTEEFEAWLESLDEDTQDSVLASVSLLEEIGPHLGRPNVDSVYGSKTSNLKELRIQHARQCLRVFFAFDPRRHAILLVGADKTGKGSGKWYKTLIKQADKLYKAHLRSIQ